MTLPRLTVQLAALAAVVWLAAMAISRALPSYGELSRRVRAEQVRADSLQVRLDSVMRDVVQPLQAEAARAEAARGAAIAHADLVQRAAAAEVAKARALLADSSTTRAALVESNRQLALRVEALMRAHAAERRAADAVITPLKRIAVEVNIVYTTAQELAETQRHQIAALEARHTWWRRVLGFSCEAGGAAGGAAAGTVAAGPPGAAVGAVVGLGVGALVCR